MAEIYIFVKLYISKTRFSLNKHKNLKKLIIMCYI